MRFIAKSLLQVHQSGVLITCLPKAARYILVLDHFHTVVPAAVLAVVKVTCYEACKYHKARGNIVHAERKSGFECRSSFCSDGLP